LLTEISTSGLAMNPTKQSVGFLSSEFLRVATGRHASYGYGARSIASLVSGNWVNVKALGPLEAITSVVGTCWAICNRFQSKTAVTLCASAVRSRAKLKNISISVVRSILQGNIAMGDGPVRANGFSHYRLDVKQNENENSRVLMDRISKLPQYATNAYLTYHVSEAERLALSCAKVVVSRDMKQASYKKCFAESDASSDVLLKASLRPVLGTNMVVGVCTVSDLLLEKEQKGILSKYPIICFLKEQLSNRDLKEIVKSLNIKVMSDIREQCFGAESKNIVVHKCISYSDACWLSKRTYTLNVYSDHEMFF